jgi:phosphoglycerol transferase MdoB-like AlkP superfamily enzyme
MMAIWTTMTGSVRRSMIFWWILFVAMQAAERLFLLPDAVAQERPSASLLFDTFVVGLRGDFITGTCALLLAASCAGFATLTLMGWRRWHGGIGSGAQLFRRALHPACAAFAMLLLILLCVDMGYYTHNRQHMDFVFLEYVGDLLASPAAAHQTNEQAVKQTGAELGDGGKWALRVLAFFALQALAIGVWGWLFSMVVQPALARWRPASGFHANALLCLGLAAGGAGFHHTGPYGIRIAHIGSSAYYTLAQNPVLFASEALRVAFVSRHSKDQAGGLDAIPYDEAVQTAQRLLSPDGGAIDARYPLLHSISPSPGSVRFERPVNVLILFVEGLDRRYLDQTYGGVPGTPFLDRLKRDSIYFEQFFTNGVQTSRGLFATFCSTYPRHGAAAMKTRYAHDYLCLPSLLQRAGYRTEMVIGQHRDLNRLQTFMSRNGLQKLLDESDFPPHAERTGLGMADGPLFDLLAQRVEQLQASTKPFFLSTLTLATHHPFAAPSSHPDVQSLKSQVEDKYVAALRYTDLELERVFAELMRKGLLRNTIVFVLGDHGRHEAVGRTDLERAIGHFTAPLMIWLDPTLRSTVTYRPRTVQTIASQVDVAPTILAMNGLMPSMAPFAGHDVSCALASDCMEHNTAYLTSVYDNLVGLATSEGLVLYSFRTETFQDVGPGFHLRQELRGPHRLAALPRYRELMALYEVSNVALDSNHIWSWREFGQRL